jgi:tRNA dimethylallyltransferase
MEPAAVGAEIGTQQRMSLHWQSEWLPYNFFMGDVFFLVGPTAVGKTTQAVELAQQFNAEIVNADAFQIYRGLDILTAKPDLKTRRRVRHHLLDQVSLGETMSALRFRELAWAALADIHSRKKNAILVGGSGLYLKAIMYGLDEVPAPDPKLRQELSGLSLHELSMRLKTLDPQFAARTDLKNPRRVIRAIEIASNSTIIASVGRGMPGRYGKPSAAGSLPPSRTGVFARDDALNYAGVVLIRDREDLYRRINERVRAMFRNGVEDEVRAASDVGPTAASALGLKEIRALLGGQTSPESCIAKIQQATRRYAKRQLTWFRHQTTFPQLNLTPFSHRDAVRAIVPMLRRAHE